MNETESTCQSWRSVCRTKTFNSIVDSESVWSVCANEANEVSLILFKQIVWFFVFIHSKNKAACCQQVGGVQSPQTKYNCEVTVSETVALCVKSSDSSSHLHLPVGDSSGSSSVNVVSRVRQINVVFLLWIFSVCDYETRLIGVTRCSGSTDGTFLYLSGLQVVVIVIIIESNPWGSFLFLKMSLNVPFKWFQWRHLTCERT